jgi:hypothetical protein
MLTAERRGRGWSCYKEGDLNQDLHVFQFSFFVQRIDLRLSTGISGDL